MTECPHCRRTFPWGRRLLCFRLRARWRCEFCGALLKCSERRRVLICAGVWVTFIALAAFPLSRPWAMTLGWSVPTTLLLMFVLVAFFDRLIILDSSGVRCRQCGYDLQGSEERCPECGTSFEEKQTELPPTEVPNHDQELSN